MAGNSHESLSQFFLREVRSLGVCPEFRNWAEQFWTAGKLWQSCRRADWMLWCSALATAAPLDVLDATSMDELTASAEASGEAHLPVIRAATACVRPALRYVPHGERRALQAIEAAEAYVRCPCAEHARSASAAAEAARVAADEGYSYPDGLLHAGDSHVDEDLTPDILIEWTTRRLRELGLKDRAYAACAATVATATVAGAVNELVSAKSDILLGQFNRMILPPWELAGDDHGLVRRVYLAVEVLTEGIRQAAWAAALAQGEVKAVAWILADAARRDKVNAAVDYLAPGWWMEIWWGVADTLAAAVQKAGASCICVPRFPSALGVLQECAGIVRGALPCPTPLLSGLLAVSNERT